MKQIIYLLMFLVLIGFVYGVNIPLSDDYDANLNVDGLQKSINAVDTYEFDKEDLTVNIDSYLITAPKETLVTFDGENLIFDIKNFETNQYLSFESDGKTYTFNSISSICQDTDTSKYVCSAVLYLPNKDGKGAVAGYKFVANTNLEINYIINFNNFQYNQEFSLTSEDEFLINSFEDNSASISITLNDDTIKTKNVVSVCGNEQYSYGGSESVGLGEGTNFVVKLIPAVFLGANGYSPSECSISCEYYGPSNTQVQGSKVNLWCGEQYPYFEIIELNNLDSKTSLGSEPLKFENNEWTCDDCVSSDVTFKLYPFENEIPVELIGGNLDSYSNGILKADQFYIGYEDLYKIRPNDGSVALSEFESTNSISGKVKEELRVQLNDGGVVYVPAGNNENSKDLELLGGHAYRLLFSKSDSNMYQLDVLDCCSAGEYDGFTSYEAIGSVSFENYGCNSDPEEKSRFLGLGRGVFSFSPLEGDICEKIAVNSKDAQGAPAVIVEPVEGVSTVDSLDVDFTETCGSTDDTRGWDYYCGIRSELDPCYSVVKKSMEGGLWSSNECSEAKTSEGSLGCHINDKKDGFYCCDPYVADTKPYANPNDYTNRKYSSIDWSSVSKSCLEVKTAPASVMSYVEEDYSCSTDGTYACIDDVDKTLAICENGQYKDSGYYCETGVCNAYHCYEGSGIINSIECCTTLTPCKEDSDCGDGYACSSSHTCNTECSVSDDCQEGYNCDGGICNKEWCTDVTDVGTYKCSEEDSEKLDYCGEVPQSWTDPFKIQLNCEFGVCDPNACDGTATDMDSCCVISLVKTIECAYSSPRYRCASFEENNYVEMCTCLNNNEFCSNVWTCSGEKSECNYEEYSSSMDICEAGKSTTDTAEVIPVAEDIAIVGSNYYVGDYHCCLVDKKSYFVTKGGCSSSYSTTSIYGSVGGGSSGLASVDAVSFDNCKGWVGNDYWANGLEMSVILQNCDLKSDLQGNTYYDCSVYVATQSDDLIASQDDLVAVLDSGDLSIYCCEGNDYESLGWYPNNCPSGTNLIDGGSCDKGIIDSESRCSWEYNKAVIGYYNCYSQSSYAALDDIAVSNNIGLVDEGERRSRDYYCCDFNGNYYLTKGGCGGYLSSYSSSGVLMGGDLGFLDTDYVADVDKCNSWRGIDPWNGLTMNSIKTCDERWDNRGTYTYYECSSLSIASSRAPEQEEKTSLFDWIFKAELTKKVI